MTNKPETLLESSTLQSLFRHNLWANITIFETCSKLSDEQLDSMVIGTYGSIRDTLIHIAQAERSYLHRLRTGQRFPQKEDEPIPSLIELLEMVQKSGEGLIEVAPTIQTGDTVEVNWDGESRSIPNTLILTQAINHATEHREQIKVMLSQIGIQPPEVDGWTFFEQMQP